MNKIFKNEDALHWMITRIPDARYNQFREDLHKAIMNVLYDYEPYPDDVCESFNVDSFIIDERNLPK